MWICLPMGMFMPALRPAHTVPEGDDRLLQIRARRIVDLRRLKAEYLPELGDIIELKFTDYEYRAYCTHEQWARALAHAAMDIDYVKFKEQSETKYGDKKLHDVYTAMWYTVFSKMSTKKHQDDYWGGQNRAIRGGRRGKIAPTTVSRKNWWDDLQNGDGGVQPILRDLIDARHGISSNGVAYLDDGIDDDPEINDLLANWDNDDANKIPVTRRPNGTIDHSHCNHAKTKGARRRCRNRANRDDTAN